MSTEYTVATPLGLFVVTWPEEEDAQPRYSGGYEAIEFFKEYLSLEQVTGRGGSLLTLEGMEPADLYGFCESAEYGVSVFPEPSEAIALMIEDADNAEDSEGMESGFALDGVSSMDKVKIAARIASLSKQLSVTAGGLEKVHLTAEIADLVRSIGADSQPQEGKIDENDLQSPDTYTNNPELATLARQAANNAFKPGSVSRGDFKREVLAGKHPELVRAALAAKDQEKIAEMAKADAKIRRNQKAKESLSQIDLPAGLTIVEEGGNLIVSGRFDDDLHARIKRVGGRWDGANGTNRRIWIVPESVGAASLKKVVTNWSKAYADRLAKEARRDQEAEKARVAAMESAPNIPDGKYGLFSVKAVGDKYKVSFAYDKSLVGEVRRLPTARYSGYDKTWTVGKADADVLLGALLNQRAQEEKREKQRADVAPVDTGVYGRFKVSLAGSRYEIDFAYDQSLVADVKKLPTARFSSARKLWTVDASEADAVRELVAKELARQEGRESEGVSFATYWGSKSARSVPGVGDVIKRGDGYHVVTEVGNGKYFGEDASSFGGTDDDLWSFRVTLRKATESEMAVEQDKEDRSAKRLSANQELRQWMREMLQSGEKPEVAEPAGELVLDTFNIYGGGDRVYIDSDRIWYVMNYGADGDAWDANNVITGGAGAVGYYIPYTKEMADRIRALAGDAVLDSVEDAFLLLDSLDHAVSIHDVLAEMLEAVDQVGAEEVLDSVSALDRVRLSNELAGLVSSVPGAVALEKIKLSAQIAEIIAQLKGASFSAEGRESKVKTAKGTRLSTNFTVIEASALIVSHAQDGSPNPEYPQELQPRDRERATSQAWVKKTAANLDPDSLGRTQRADSGAPIIGSDRVVESGNGRTMAIREAYRQGTADEYREWLIEEADYFGLSVERIRSMKEPVLVRVRSTAIDRAAFAVEANQDDKLAMTATETARADARRLDTAMISKLSGDGDLLAAANRDFLIAFMRSLGDTEAAQYSTSDGKPTAGLVARVQAAIFAKAYNDDRLLEMTADSAKPEIANVIAALNIAAPDFIQAQAADRAQAEEAATKVADSVELSLNQQAVDAIIGATRALQKAKDSGMSVTDFLDQQDMFNELDPAVAAMALFISNNNRSPKRLGIAFKAMAEFVHNEIAQRQNQSLFGDALTTSFADIVEAANRRLQQEYGEGAFQITVPGLFDSSG